MLHVLSLAIPLETFSQVHPEVCLPGDSESSQVTINVTITGFDFVVDFVLGLFACFLFIVIATKINAQSRGLSILNPLSFKVEIRFHASDSCVL